MKKHEKDSWENRDDIRTESEKRRQDALKHLEIAKGIEKHKASKGWVWIKKEKVSKQIHPDNLEGHIADGWQLTK